MGFYNFELGLPKKNISKRRKTKHLPNEKFKFMVIKVHAFILQFLIIVFFPHESRSLYVWTKTVFSFPKSQSIPKLQGSIHPLPGKAHAGDLRQLVLELRNPSEFPVKVPCLELTCSKKTS